jgi:hypothetical protein
MKIAAFNVENLFDRAKAFNEDNSNKTRRIIEAVTELNGLFEKIVYALPTKNGCLSSSIYSS